ncbi:hypothetical protein BD410DRAFT_120384 [Rickenella mellea]|uniref:BTB domain-containing protein n=1 Tax=Rickenella mellea TaxID=50990 RepID=A0A4Y7PK74_9AGAM|nr:hypothetical protein BD410DRAFT_120384 [Rickenella mellea]
MHEKHISDSDTLAVSNASPNTEFHPLFFDPDADITLQSDDGVQFRVRSAIMTMSSGFFKAKLGLPGNPVAQAPIMMTEPGHIIAALLSIIDPQFGISQFDHGHIWDILKAADKYDMPSVMGTLRHLIGVHSRAGDTDPIKTYAYACRYGWEDVAKAASTRTLDTDLSALSETEISLMDTISLFRLQKLHRSRGHALIELMDIKAEEGSSHLVFHRCGNKERPYRYLFPCCAVRGRSHFWILAKHIVLREMEKCPSGRTLRLEEFWNRPELTPLWEIRLHPGCNCGIICMVFDKKGTMQEVLRMLDSDHLPVTV